LPYASNRGGLLLQPLFELRDKDVYYSLFESLKSVFLHGWQRFLLFNPFYGPDFEDAYVVRHAAFSPSPLCYVLSNSISRTNLRYLSQEIRRISFQEIRDPSLKINETLHDRREDLVAFFKAGLVETITYVPPNVDRYIGDLQDHYWPDEDLTQHAAISGHRRTLEETLELEKFLMETFQLLMSSISVQDAKMSVKQGQLSNQQSLRATQLTILASIYVPLSFVTGIFGMNLKELNGSSLSIWVFFVVVVIAAAVTAIIFLVLQIRSKQTRIENDAEKVERSDDASTGIGDASKTHARVFGNNRSAEKSMA
jgi:CorA-like Mg2+ transporter protein